MVFFIPKPGTFGYPKDLIGGRCAPTLYMGKVVANNPYPASDPRIQREGGVIFCTYGGPPPGTKWERHDRHQYRHYCNRLLVYPAAELIPRSGSPNKELVLGDYHVYSCVTASKVRREQIAPVPPATNPTYNFLDHLKYPGYKTGLLWNGFDIWPSEIRPITKISAKGDEYTLYPRWPNDEPDPPNSCSLRNGDWKFIIGADLGTSFWWNPEDDAVIVSQLRVRAQGFLPTNLPFCLVLYLEMWAGQWHEHTNPITSCTPSPPPTYHSTYVTHSQANETESDVWATAFFM